MVLYLTVNAKFPFKKHELAVWSSWCLQTQLYLVEK